MSDPRFDSADDFLTALTHELVQHGTQSSKIDSFRRIAAQTPEWDPLAKTAINLRDAYEKHRQAGKHRDAGQEDLSSGEVAGASGGISGIARGSAVPLGTFLLGIALMCVVWPGASVYEPVDAAMANGGATPQTGAVSAAAISSMDPLPVGLVGIGAPMIRAYPNVEALTPDRWAVIRETFDETIAQQGKIEAILLTQMLLSDTPASVSLRLTASEQAGMVLGTPQQTEPE